MVSAIPDARKLLAKYDKILKLESGKFDLSQGKVRELSVYLLCSDIVDTLR